MGARQTSTTCIRVAVALRSKSWSSRLRALAGTCATHDGCTQLIVVCLWSCVIRICSMASSALSPAPYIPMLPSHLSSGSSTCKFSCGYVLPALLGVLRICGLAICYYSMSHVLLSRSRGVRVRVVRARGEKHPCIAMTFCIVWQTPSSLPSLLKEPTPMTCYPLQRIGQPWKVFTCSHCTLSSLGRILHPVWPAPHLAAVRNCSNTLGAVIRHCGRGITCNAQGPHHASSYGRKEVAHPKGKALTNRAHMCTANKCRKPIQFLRVLRLSLMQMSAPSCKPLCTRRGLCTCFPCCALNDCLCSAATCTSGCLLQASRSDTSATP